MHYLFPVLSLVSIFIGEVAEICSVFAEFSVFAINKEYTRTYLLLRNEYRMGIPYSCNINV